MHMAAQPLRRHRRYLAALMTLALICISCLTSRLASAHDAGHASASKRYTRTFAAYDAPDVQLLDMTGAPVRLTQLLGQPGPLLLQFIFTTCPAVCPALSALFSAALRQLGADAEPLRMISISIDPEHDTPARLRAYAQRLKAQPQWRFLTGRRGDIAAVQKAFDAYQSNKMRHEPLTYLRASPSAPWVRLDGFMSARDLVAEYRQLVSP